MGKQKILSTAAIVASSKPLVFENCLGNLHNQSCPFARILIVPWGPDKDAIIRVAKSYANTEIVPAHPSQGIAANRNAAIEYLSNDATSHVVFIDDDLYLNNDWHLQMQKACRNDDFGVCYSSVVVFRENERIIQSCGHILKDYRPLDLGYRKIIETINNLQNPQFPCANCAFVPWKAIEAIHKHENEIWDTHFQRMTCFDFGMKLRFLKFDCKLVKMARGSHTGYLGDKTRVGTDHVRKELTARMLIYKKYLPRQKEEEALRALHEKLVSKWYSMGYPSAYSIKGGKLISIYKDALYKTILLGKTLNLFWKSSNGNG